MFNAEVSKRRILESLISCGITVSEILASFPQEEASGCPWHHWMISLQACLQVLDRCPVFKSHILCATRSAPSDPGGSVPPRHKATEVWPATSPLPPKWESVLPTRRGHQKSPAWRCAFQIPLQLFTQGCSKLPATQTANLSHSI